MTFDPTSIKFSVNKLYKRNQNAGKLVTENGSTRSVEIAQSSVKKILGNSSSHNTMNNSPFTPEKGTIKTTPGSNSVVLDNNSQEIFTKNPAFDSKLLETKTVNPLLKRKMEKTVPKRAVPAAEANDAKVNSNKEKENRENFGNSFKLDDLGNGEKFECLYSLYSDLAAKSVSLKKNASGICANSGNIEKIIVEIGNSAALIRGCGEVVDRSEELINQGQEREAIIEHVLVLLIRPLADILLAITGALASKDISTDSIMDLLPNCLGVCEACSGLLAKANDPKIRAIAQNVIKNRIELIAKILIDRAETMQMQIKTEAGTSSTKHELACVLEILEKTRRMLDFVGIGFCCAECTAEIIDEIMSKLPRILGEIAKARRENNIAIDCEIFQYEVFYDRIIDLLLLIGEKEKADEMKKMKLKILFFAALSC
jgi:hypothetical protein